MNKSILKQHLWSKSILWLDKECKKVNKIERFQKIYNKNQSGVNWEQYWMVKKVKKRFIKWEKARQLL